MKTKNVKILAVIFTLAIIVGSKSFVFGQAGNITATPQTTPWIWSDYVDPLIADDKVFIFCSPDANGDTLLGTLSVQGGYGNCTYIWGKYDGDPTSPTYQQFVEFITGPIPTGPSSTVEGLQSGFYQVIITCNEGLPSETTVCRRAHVFVNETVIDFDPIDPGCQSFDITGGIIDAVADFTIYDPPPTPFIVSDTTDITVCFWANHSYVSDLGFYLIGPSGGRIDLMPSIAGWTTSGTNLDASVVLGCSPGMINNTNANSGDNYTEFCFSSALPAGDPAFTPCIANLVAAPVTGISGTFASCEAWDEVYGEPASSGGWAVQVFDCVGADVGHLERVTITFEGDGQCGNTTYSYDSGSLNVQINDGNCDSVNATTYTVPLKPTSQHTITNEVTAYWTSYPSTFPNNWNPAWGSNDFALNPVPSIDPEPLLPTEFCLVVEDHLYDTLGLEIMPTGFYQPCAPTVCHIYNTLPTNPSIINPPVEVCQNEPPFQLNAVEWGGTWTGPGMTAGGWFFPSNAFLGPNVITHGFGGVCAADTTISILVVGAPEVDLVVDTICDPTNTNYMIQVTLSGGSPGSYTATDLVNNVTPYGAFGSVWESPWITSGSSYIVEFNDFNDCDPTVITGSHNCSCESYAANMYDPSVSSQLVELCAFDLTSFPYQLGTEVLDGNDGWSFILHTLPYGTLGDVLAIDNDTDHDGIAEFAFLSSTMTYGQTYYVSHVVGNNLGTSVSHIVDLVGDGCLSVSPGRPVKWYEFPIADAGSDKQVCGKTITLEADTPTVGIGQWTAVGASGINWYPNFDDPAVTTTIPNYDTNQFGCDLNTEYKFRWTVSNGPCETYSDVDMLFKPQPSAFAGNDQIGNNAVCGLTTSLLATYSLCSNQVGVSSGYWSGGDQSFSNSQNPATNTNVNNYGQYTFRWTEYNGDCVDYDWVTVEFLENPVVDAGLRDSVCGNSYTLDAISTMGVGFWEGPSSATFSCLTCPETAADVVYPPGTTTVDVLYTWNESNGVCDGEDDVIITYSKKPVATAGLDQVSVCGPSTYLDADVLGFEYALGTWKSDFVGVQFGNLTDPLSQVSIPNTGSMNGSNSGSFGDSSYVEVDMIWVMDNNKCIDEDIVTITFHQTPVAFAGPDTSVCGFQYTMNAQYSIGSPKGKWSVVSNPGGSPPSFSDNGENPHSVVTVQDEGLYTFRWKEDNIHNQQCSTTDDVDVFFIEIPDIDAGNDRFVCGDTFNLEAVPSTGNGVWSEHGTYIADATLPNTEAIHNPTGSNDSILYVWQEYNEDPWGMNSCAEKDSVYIVYMVVPTPEHSWIAGSSTDHVCGKKEEDILVAFSPSIGNGDVQAYWVNNDATFYPNSKAKNPDSVIVNFYGIQEFYWRIENSVGDSTCSANSDTIYIDFIQQPVAMPGQLTDTACGQFYNFNAEFSVDGPTSNVAGRWTGPVNVDFFTEVFILAGDTTLIEGDSIPDGWVRASTEPDLTPDIYEFRWTESNYGVDIANVCFDFEEVSITFAPKPTGRAKIVEHPFCLGTKARIKADNDFAITKFDWNNDFDGGKVTEVTAPGTLADPGAGPIWVRWEDANYGDAHTIRLITTNKWECTSPADVDIVYEPEPLPVEASISPATCGDPTGEVELELGDEEYTDPLSYEWLIDSIHSFADPVNAIQTGLMTGDYNFRVHGLSWNQYNNGYNPDAVRCSDTLALHVPDTGYIAALFRLPTLVDTVDGVAPQEMEFVNLTYNTDSNYINPGYYHFRTTDDEPLPAEAPDAEYQWRFYRIPVDSVPDLGAPITILPSENPIEFDGESVIEEDNPILTFELGGYYKVKQTAVSGYGCRDEAVFGYFYIEEKEELEPGVNVFTPNGDNQNDYFEFTAHSLSYMEGQIFNRWGKKVFEWTWNEDDQTPNPGWWDGKLDNGQDAAAGVYYYVIKGTGLKGKDFSGKEYTGFVHLIRE